MLNIIVRPTQLAHKIWDEYLTKDSVAVDATLGTGRDALYLAERAARVYGFDIQKEALEQSRELLRDFRNVEFIQDSHDRMKEYVQEADIIVFNLGYLPRGDQTITTRGETTLEAIRASLDIIRVNGLISIAMYTGHEEGKRESRMVLDYCGSLDPERFHVLRVNLINQKKDPPELVLITKKRCF